MSKYRVTAPFIPSMGSIAPFFVSSTMSGETKEEAALWEINSMRRHDGQQELDKLPRGFRFERIG